MKLPFFNRWIKLYWMTPDIPVGYYTSYYDAVMYWVLNLWLFSIEIANADIYSRENS